MSKRGKPIIYTNIPTLTDNRNDFMNKMSNESSIKKKDLNESIRLMNEYKDFFKDKQLFPKKEKAEKYGKVGMNELAKIVLDMNQDIKQIKQAQSLAGAQSWIETHGYNGKYGAYEKDINGDSIPDVVVQRLDNEGKPIDGNYVIVNGYTTGESTYPYRHAYYDAFPTREERKQARKDGLTYRAYINEMYRPQYEDQMKIIGYGSDLGKQFEKKLKTAGYTKVIKPHDRSPYQVFCSSVIKPIFDVFKHHLGNQLGGAAFSKIAATIWNQAILAPAMVYVYGDDVLNVSDEEWKKLRNKKDVKRATKLRVVEYINDLRKTFDFVPIFTAIVNEALDIRANPNDPLIEYFLKARLLNLEPPSNPVTEQQKQIINERWNALSQ